MNTFHCQAHGQVLTNQQPTFYYTNTPAINMRNYPTVLTTPPIHTPTPPCTSVSPPLPNIIQAQLNAQPLFPPVTVTVPQTQVPQVSTLNATTPQCLDLRLSPPSHLEEPKTVLTESDSSFFRLPVITLDPATGRIVGFQPGTKKEKNTKTVKVVKKAQKNKVKTAPDASVPKAERKTNKTFGHRSKQTRINQVLEELETAYNSNGLLTQEDLRGPQVCRVHVKCFHGLNQIQKALSEVCAHPKIQLYSIAFKVTMKNRFQKKGFNVFMECLNTEMVGFVQEVFEAYTQWFPRCPIAMPREGEELTVRDHENETVLEVPDSGDFFDCDFFGEDQEEEEDELLLAPSTKLMIQSSDSGKSDEEETQLVSKRSWEKCEYDGTYKQTLYQSHYSMGFAA